MVDDLSTVQALLVWTGAAVWLGFSSLFLYAAGLLLFSLMVAWLETCITCFRYRLNGIEVFYSLFWPVVWQNGVNKACGDETMFNRFVWCGYDESEDAE